MVVSDDHEVDNDYAGDRSADDEPSELFLARRAAAYQAYYEHMPMPRRMLPFGPYQQLRTQRGFGDLVDLYMLDGRQFRSPQACGPGPLVAPCAELYDAQRTMLGAAQESWLDDALGAGRARWNLLGQQTLLAHFDQSGEEDLRYWADGWNGYPAARARLVEFLAERRIAEIAAGVATALGASAQSHYRRHHPATVNSEREAIFAAQVGERIFGAGNVIRDAEPTTGSEDFSYMLQVRPGAYVWLGHGGGASGCNLHNPNYDFNDQITPLGAGYLAALVEAALPLDSRSS